MAHFGRMFLAPLPFAGQIAPKMGRFGTLMVRGAQRRLISFFSPMHASPCHQIYGRVGGQAHLERHQLLGETFRKASRHNSF